MPPKGLQGSLRGATPSAAARVHAAHGLRYDTIETLSRAIDQAPRDRRLRAERAALLDQVGLPRAAACIRVSRP